MLANAGTFSVVFASTVLNPAPTPQTWSPVIISKARIQTCALDVAVYRIHDPDTDVRAFIGMVLSFPVTVAPLYWSAGNPLRLPVCRKDRRSHLAPVQLRKLPVSRVDSVLARNIEVVLIKLLYHILSFFL